PVSRRRRGQGLHLASSRGLPPPRRQIRIPSEELVDRAATALRGLDPRAQRRRELGHVLGAVHLHERIAVRYDFQHYFGDVPVDQFVVRAAGLDVGVRRAPRERRVRAVQQELERHGDLTDDLVDPEERSCCGIRRFRLCGIELPLAQDHCSRLLALQGLCSASEFIDISLDVFPRGVLKHLAVGGKGGHQGLHGRAVLLDGHFLARTRFIQKLGGALERTSRCGVSPAAAGAADQKGGFCYDAAARGQYRGDGGRYFPGFAQ
ncbi:unnamed protein product, partial [Pelagomonas calceolata]